VRSSTCRACGAADFASIVDLGAQPLANAFRRANEPGEPLERHPLELVRCRACALVQITELVPPETLFRRYLYYSSYSTTMLDHARLLAQRMMAERGLGPQSLVVEVASNDGYLLVNYARAGVRVLGIDPAIEVAEVAERERGVPTLREFFGVELARELAARGERADLLHANNVLAHVADLNGFVEGLRLLLAPGGVLVSESPYLRPCLEQVAFDTIYHEHLYYYSLTALDRLLRRHDLVIQDCEPIPVHGGSLRVFAAPAGSARVRPSVGALLEEEARWGVDGDAAYTAFATRVERARRAIPELVRGLKARHNRVAAYGAAAKGSMLLNATGLGSDQIEYVCDRSPHKQGHLMPGSNVPIVGPERLSSDRPDYCLLLAWNLTDEIVAQQRDYLERGGRFIVPLPLPRILEAAT
jgi:SAM-dependent methyltransferase